MMNVRGWFVEDPLTTGTYKYDGVGDLAGHRFHLRVDGGHKGVLMVDASKLLFLNGTAVDHVRALLEGWDEARTIKYVRKRYRHAKREKVAADRKRIKAQLLEFLSGDVDVVRQTISPSPSIGADELPSPYRMDLALTYRCQNECSHCYNEDREVKELPKEKWLSVIDRLWDIGIPHIVFTGGEPTQVPFLRDLIARSEANGQITGLITNGRAIAEPGYLQGLVDSGLDHVQVTVLSHQEPVHDRLVGVEGAWKETIEGIKRAVDIDVYLSTNTTILADNLEEIEDTMRFLIDLGVKNISVNGIIRSGKGKEASSVTYDQLETTLAHLVAIADEKDINLVWYTPTPYCDFNPLQYGLGIKQCTACSLNMAIEPDGTVLPCQSYYEPLGNILKDEWRGIWDQDLCKDIRDRGYMAEKCAECDLAQVCGGGCPLALEHGDYVCLDRMSSM
jgi:radical SAM protein with 4Fe4S-binding SPASM domain